jgi:hypothetical protein
MCARQVVGHVTRHTGVTKHGSDVVSARLGPALKFTKHDFAVIDVMDDTGRNAIEADERQSAHDLLGWDELRELLLIPEAILQGENGGVGCNQGRDQLRELIVGGGLKADYHQITRADCVGSSRTFWPHIEIAFSAADRDAVAPDDFIIRTQEEVDVAVIAAKFGAVKAAEGAATDDGDFHRAQKKAL